MADLTQIGKNIKTYRMRQGLTQRALADNVLVSFQAISAWERGLSVPDLEMPCGSPTILVCLWTRFLQRATALLLAVTAVSPRTERVLVPTASGAS